MRWARRPPVCCLQEGFYMWVSACKDGTCCRCSRVCYHPVTDTLGRKDSAACPRKTDLWRGGKWDCIWSRSAGTSCKDWPVGLFLALMKANNMNPWRSCRSMRRAYLRSYRQLRQNILTFFFVNLNVTLARVSSFTDGHALSHTPTPGRQLELVKMIQMFSRDQAKANARMRL